jgi:hypothetical protein
MTTVPLSVQEPLRAPHFPANAWLALDGSVLESFLSWGGECVCFHGFTTAGGQREFFECLERGQPAARLRSLVFNRTRDATGAVVFGEDEDAQAGLQALSRAVARAGGGLERLWLEHVKYVPREQAWLRDALAGASGLHTLRLAGFQRADLGDEAFGALVRLVPQLRVLSVPGLGWARNATRCEVCFFFVVLLLLRFLRASMTAVFSRRALGRRSRMRRGWKRWTSR